MTNWSEILVALTVFFWVIWSILKGRKIYLPPLTIPILLFAALGLISLVVSLHLFSPLEVIWGSVYLWRWLVFAGLYFLVATMVVAKEVPFWLKIIFLTGPILAVFGFLQLIFFPDFSFMNQFGWDPHFGRLLSTFYDPNFLGGYLTIIFILGLFLISQNQVKKVDYLMIGNLALIFLALALTFSRSAYISFAVAIFLFSFLKKSFRLLGLALLLIFLLGAFYWPRWQLEQSRQINRAATAAARVSSWQEGLSIFQQNPLLGIGFNNYRSWQGVYNGEDSFTNLRPGAGSDSSLIFLLATTGVLGTAIYLAILFSFVKMALSVPSRLLYLPILAALLVHSFFVNSLFYPAVMALFWLLAGILDVQRNS